MYVFLLLQHILAQQIACLSNCSNIGDEVATVHWMQYVLESLSPQLLSMAIFEGV